MHYALILHLLFLLMLANGSPVLAKRLLGTRFGWPVDGNRSLMGQPVFGHSKTVRGLVIALMVTSAGGLWLGPGFGVGLLVGATAMAGDLLSSFVKRRLGMVPSSRAVGLDQIPEALLPLLACRAVLPLTAGDIVLGTAIFSVGELGLSRVLFRLRLRDEPY